MQLYPPSWFDDAANGYKHIKTVPLASSMGAEIRGVNIATITMPSSRKCAPLFSATR